MHYLIITASFLLFGFTASQALRYIDYKVMQREVDIIEEVGYKMTDGASSAERSQSETRIKVMLNAEIVVSTEDGAGMNANQDYINQQIKQAERDLNACSSGFERIR